MNFSNNQFKQAFKLPYNTSIGQYIEETKIKSNTPLNKNYRTTYTKNN